MHEPFSPTVVLYGVPMLFYSGLIKRILVVQCGHLNFLLIITQVCKLGLHTCWTCMECWFVDLISAGAVFMFTAIKRLGSIISQLKKLGKRTVLLDCCNRTSFAATSKGRFPL